MPTPTLVSAKAPLITPLRVRVPAPPMLASAAKVTGPVAVPPAVVLLLVMAPAGAEASPRPLIVSGSAPMLTPLTSSAAPLAMVVPAATVPKGVVLTAPVVRVPALIFISPVNAPKLLVPLPRLRMPTPVLVRVPAPWSWALPVPVPVPLPSSRVSVTPVATSNVAPPVPMLNI